MTLIDAITIIHAFFDGDVHEIPLGLNRAVHMALDNLERTALYRKKMNPHPLLLLEGETLE